MFKDTPAFSGYSVDNLDEALRFYRDTLELAVTQTNEGLDITLGGGTKLFLYAKPDHVPATFTVMNFVVDDIDQTVDELKSKGITLENYDMGEMHADEKGIYRGAAAGRGPDIAWFKDPAGNILSVIQK
jgi:catechol 2,3-dioxygenase-like lactoylglutathione lyase family enzyme